MIKSALASPAARAAVIFTGYLALVATVLLVPSRASVSSPGDRQQILAGSRAWLEGNCSSCHAIYGLGGHLGPDLTSVIRLKGAPYAKVVVETGRPGMPACGFDTNRMNDLLAYLDFIGRTGSYPLRKRPLPAFGALQ